MGEFTRQDMVDAIATAIDDSMGPDWNSHIGAEAVVRNCSVFELYEALNELRDWAQATAPHGVCGPPLGCITCGFVAKADAALAKASAPNPMQEKRG